MDNHEEPVKKKRGRKKKSEIVSSTLQNEPVVAKKRGRKPKGGKITLTETNEPSEQNTVTNVILHLKCSMDDIINNGNDNVLINPHEYNPMVPPTIQSFNVDNTKRYSKLDYETIQTTHNTNVIAPAYMIDKTNTTPSVKTQLCTSCNNHIQDSENTDDENDISVNELHMKIKELKLQLYKATNTDKKSACFWCTYEFDNNSYYIPKFISNDEYSCYGSFCRPECAAAYLMEENIDDSSKFERYHLLNQVYGAVYNHTKSIKPAPNPHYLLDKFYGNLSIQEYRKMLGTDHMLVVVDKPMTRVLPELHEDMDNVKNGISSQKTSKTMYKVKRQSEHVSGPSKTEIMKEQFGL